MPKYECPKCGARSFSFWRKQLLGPLRKVKCTNCGASVSVSLGKGLLVSVATSLVPFIGSLIGLYGVRSWGLWGVLVGLAVGGVVACVAAAWIWHRYVPLVIKDA